MSMIFRYLAWAAMNGAQLPNWWSLPQIDTEQVVRAVGRSYVAKMGLPQ